MYSLGLSVLLQLKAEFTVFLLPSPRAGVQCPPHLQSMWLPAGSLGAAFMVQRPKCVQRGLLCSITAYTVGISHILTESINGEALWDFSFFIHIFSAEGERAENNTVVWRTLLFCK